MAKHSAADVVLAPVATPAPDAQVPVLLTDETILERRDKLIARMVEEGIGTLIIYDDLEHSGNFEYLTGFVTRFEEGLLVLEACGDATLILGNENLKMASHCRITNDFVHTPLFSLPNQPMEGDIPLTEALRKAGVMNGKPTGIVGWKMFTSDLRDNLQTYDVPHYIVEAVKEVAGDRVCNASYLLIGQDGARTTNNPNEIAHYEYAAALASDCVLRTMERIEPGISELELGNTMAAHGQARSVVTIAATGDRYQKANFYPLDKNVQVGDKLSLTVGYRGGCSSRACYAVHDASELPAGDADWLDVVAKPYFAAYATWLEEIHVGMTGGELHALVEEVLPRATYGWDLCPGHLVAEEEWLSSPVYEGSTAPIESGMLFQIDIIPSMAGHAGVSAESTVCIADAQLRERIAAEYPELWARFQARRAYMIDELGIQLSEDVLPMCSTVAWLRPFALDKGSALKLA